MHLKVDFTHLNTSFRLFLKTGAHQLLKGVHLLAILIGLLISELAKAINNLGSYFQSIG